jgi:hypothetical protein
MRQAGVCVRRVYLVVATAAVAVLLSLVGNLATNTVDLSHGQVVAAWIVVGVLAVVSIVLAVVQHRSETSAATQLSNQVEVGARDVSGQFVQVSGEVDRFEQHQHQHEHHYGSPPATTTNHPAIGVGVGVPGWKRQFQELYDQVSRRTQLGDAMTEVHRDGPGVVQRAESNGSPNEWLLCGLPGRPPTMVAESIWESLHFVGSRIPDGDALAALGFPIIEQTDGLPAQIITDEATDVALRGGRWGNGHLFRTYGSPSWSWEPVPGFNFDTSRVARNWTGGASLPSLRVRAIATLPWDGAIDRRISATRRREIAEALPISHLAGAVTMLSRRRGADLRAGRWSLGPNRNGPDTASYSSAIVAPDSGQQALSCEVMVALPNTVSSAVVTCAELRVDDFAAWAGALRAADKLAKSDLRLSLDEVVEFFVVAWTTATEVLPTLLSPEPYGELWIAPPTVELRLTTEHQPGVAGTTPQLPDFVDFTAFGDRIDDHLTEMAVTITAPPQMNPTARRDLTRRAVVRMGEEFGFLDAAVDRL